MFPLPTKPRRQAVTASHYMSSTRDGGERVKGVTYVESKAAPLFDKLTQNISRYRRLNDFQTVNSDFDRMWVNSCV